MYNLTFAKQAVKALEKMPQVRRERMMKELGKIANSPHGYSGDWKPLKGSDYWRLRVGGWRAICLMMDDELVVLVLKIGPRGDVYK
ncbi:MAG: type II toxin-antitoxin system RelE/ParE family toxin [Mariprofundaceae bacterium]|nr:type II toxin-antitoxin system RelE/ParE family toxin [Mariprofundaceae bacterium]